MITNHPDTGSHHPWNGSILLAYLHSQQMIRLVIPMDLGLDRANWTETGHKRGGGGQDLGRGVGYGGCWRRRYMRKDFTNLCQNSWDALQAARRAL
jgi:hypothetical protein